MSHIRAIAMKTETYPGPIHRCIAIIRKARPMCLLGRTVLIGFLAMVISGIGHILANPAPEESQEIADLVDHLAKGSHETDPVPADLATGLGYEPVVTGGKMAKPTGGCSTPIPLGPDAFEEACRTHDLGYDLLRTAEANGRRLGVWARFELDRRLYIDLLSTCQTLRCRTAAATYYTAVTTNSIRQGFGAPNDEPATPWVGVGLLVICFALLSDPRGGLRARAGRWAGHDRVPLAVRQDIAGPEPMIGVQRSRDRIARPILSPTIEQAIVAARLNIWRHRRYRRSTV